MPVFPSGETAVKVFSDLFGVLLEDEEFVARARQEDLSVRLVHTRPDCEIFVAPQGVFADGHPQRPAAITLKMSCDTAHALWMGRLPVPVALHLDHRPAHLGLGHRLRNEQPGFVQGLESRGQFASLDHAIQDDGNHRREWFAPLTQGRDAAKMTEKGGLDRGERLVEHRHRRALSFRPGRDQALA